MRMYQWLIISVLATLATWHYSAGQLTTLLWKGNMLSCLFWLAYWLDRTAFPYARPHAAPDEALGAVYQIRRALIMSAVVIAGCIGI